MEIIKEIEMLTSDIDKTLNQFEVSSDHNGNHEPALQQQYSTDVTGIATTTPSILPEMTSFITIRIEDDSPLLLHLKMMDKYPIVFAFAKGPGTTRTYVTYLNAYLKFYFNRF
jgi:hypothetical protein